MPLPLLGALGGGGMPGFTGGAATSSSDGEYSAGMDGGNWGSTGGYRGNVYNFGSGSAGGGSGSAGFDSKTLLWIGAGVAVLVLLWFIFRK